MTTRTLISAADLARHRTAYRLVLGVVTALFLLAFAFPLYWMVTGAVKSPAELGQPTPTLIPQTFRPANYADAWQSLQVAHFFANTVKYALGGWLIQVSVDVLAAYALSRLRPVLGRVVLGAMLASLMLPATALLIPAYLTVTDVPIFGWNLLNTPWAIWLPAAANGFNIFLLKRFFDSIPSELLEAAAIDGASAFRMLWSIILPVSRPILGVVSIFAVVNVWKDFVWPLLVLPDTGKMPVSVAISQLSQEMPQNVLIAALVIASIPAVAVFFLFQRNIMAGLTAGGLKG
jgi:multiple sugar transport system permease protein